MCNRLSFMYGMPYNHSNLEKEIHSAPDNQPVLPRLFGAIPLQMYIHGGKNIRRGQATDMENQVPDAAFVSDRAREQFRALDKVTLIAGALNKLWHRDSIDRMYEWLLRGSAAFMPRFTKYVFPDCGHQDLLWGRSRLEVFGAIAAGLRPGVPAQRILPLRRDHALVAARASRQRSLSQGMPRSAADCSPRR
jgi:hypothetical protein